MIEQILGEADEKMKMAVRAFAENLAAIPTGRAHPAMFNTIEADYYGAMTPINQLAGVSVPEPRLAILTPFDSSVLGNIERAIRESDLGVNPSNDGRIIRVTLPELTGERRKEYIRVAQARAEEARASVRNSRATAHAALGKLIMDMVTGEDEVRRADTELDNTTAKYVAQIDELLKRKEAELLYS